MAIIYDQSTTMFTIWHACLLLLFLVSIGILIVFRKRVRQGRSVRLPGKIAISLACVMLAFIFYLSCYFYLRWTDRLVVGRFSDDAHLCWSAVKNPNMITENLFAGAMAASFDWPL